MSDIVMEDPCTMTLNDHSVAIQNEQIDPDDKASKDDKGLDDKTMDEESLEFHPCVRVKKWSAVAVWSYDIMNDTCPICHNEVALPCIRCEADSRFSQECTIATGNCAHSFHCHCIMNWLKTRSTCPLDDIEWEFVQI